MTFAIWGIGGIVSSSLSIFAFLGSPGEGKNPEFPVLWS